MDASKSTTFKNPKRNRLNIACVYLTNYFAADDQGEIAKAKTVLDQHNLQLEVWGASKTFNNTLNYPDPVPHDFYDDAVNKQTYTALLTSARALISKNCSFSTFLTVVFGQFKHPGIGITPPGMPIAAPLCLVSPNPNPDKMDLLHEMGHAASLHHETAAANFMNLANGRSEVMRFQVESFAKAWYAVG
jgi:hypothetical protein